ncbi:MAG: 3-dehydroquinate synthase [Firmicutes bacterium]|nr:3-dehydroquinate synthase [Bacillota bacterium]
MATIKIDLGEKSYPIIVGFNLLDKLGEELRRQLPGVEKALVISDRIVASLWGEQCLLALRDAGFHPKLASIPPGEKSKKLSVAEELYGHALDADLDRRSPIIALGGGVVGDLAGFVAATFLRGVPFVQVPTTLLAQVDSSVGGKVAVNHQRGKNLIGSFYQPSLVLVDLDLLQTLDERQFKAGLVEVVKAAAVWDKAFFLWLNENFFNLLKRESKTIHEAVFRAITIKTEIVSRDEHEKNLRRILNFGHTFGHALEAVTEYDYYLHGEAVLVGMKMATTAAWKMGFLSKNEYEQLQGLFASFGCYPLPNEVAPQKIIEALNYDKKREGERIIFILPQSIGKVLASSLPEEIIEAVLHSYI